VAGHYTGWSQEGKLQFRLADHALGRGARLTQVQHEAGGTWVVADVEPGTRDRETQLKERSATRRCSVCKAVRAIDEGKITKEEALAQWESARPYDRKILREIFGMEPEPPTPDPVPVREITPAPPAPESKYEITPEMDALVDALCEGWLREKKAQAEAEAEREHVRELDSAQLPDVFAPCPPPEPQAEMAPVAEAEPELEIG
jgi:hypothetical protein